MQELFARYGSTGIMLVVWVVVIYALFASNKKKQKKQNEMLNSLKAGDTVVTIGGIKGVISSFFDSSKICNDVCFENACKWSLPLYEGFMGRLKFFGKFKIGMSPDNLFVK